MSSLKNLVRNFGVVGFLAAGCGSVPSLRPEVPTRAEVLNVIDAHAVDLFKCYQFETPSGSPDAVCIRNGQVLDATRARVDLLGIGLEPDKVDEFIGLATDSVFAANGLWDGKGEVCFGGRIVDMNADQGFKVDLGDPFESKVFDRKEDAQRYVDFVFDPQGAPVDGDKLEVTCGDYDGPRYYQGPLNFSVTWAEVDGSEERSAGFLFRKMYPAEVSK